MDPKIAAGCGCLLGMAAGDAMGNTVDKLTWDEICENYGPNGLLGYDLSNDDAQITSHTQLAAFVSNALLLGAVRGKPDQYPKYIALGFREWEKSQRLRPNSTERIFCWLTHIPEMRRHNCKDNRMLDALHRDQLGTPERPMFRSDAPGSLTAAVAVALCRDAAKLSFSQVARLGTEAVALTHGEPDSAGVPKEFAELTIALPYNDPEAVRRAFAQHPNQIAAIIVEPYPGNAGFYLPKPGYLEFLREITAKEGALLIFDEVMTGFRISPAGVQGKHNITPDLTTLGKVIGGGLPVGAFGGRADIMNCVSPLGPVYQAGTLSGNPVAMAAGLAQLRELEATGAYDRLEKLGARLEDGVRAALADLQLPLTFKRSGSMFCLFFTTQDVTDLASATTADFDMFRRYFHSMLEQGVYVAPSPYETGFISTAHTEADIDATVAAMRTALAAAINAR